jgi:hypothetical protein
MLYVIMLKRHYKSWVLDTYLQYALNSAVLTRPVEGSLPLCTNTRVVNFSTSVAEGVEKTMEEGEIFDRPLDTLLRHNAASS